MSPGSAIAARATGDVSRRDMASEWGGPEPAAPHVAVALPREAPRRVMLRKP